MNEISLEKIVKPLSLWYCSNARVLEWRDDPTPYHVWVSEIMLQQTRVEAVKFYFHRFIEKLPTIAALASVSEPELLKLWEGLGYYNRVRNMQAAAKLIIEKYQGLMPDQYNQIIELPGIGSYTAGAILSLAYGQKIPAVDGNVLRVISRILASKEDISKQKTKDWITSLLVPILPDDIRNFNQALMELGALVCLPHGKPLCASCPVRHLCMAYAKDEIDQIPYKAPKKERKIEKKTVFLLQYHHRIAIQKRPSTGLLANLYEFPNCEGHLSLLEIKQMFPNAIYREGKTVKHVFTHIEWHMISYEIDLSSPLSNYNWVDSKDLKEIYALPTAFQKFLKKE